MVVVMTRDALVASRPPRGAGVSIQKKYIIQTELMAVTDSSDADGESSTEETVEKDDKTAPEDTSMEADVPGGSEKNKTEGSTEDAVEEVCCELTDDEVDRIAESVAEQLENRDDVALVDAIADVLLLFASGVFGALFGLALTTQELQTNLSLTSWFFITVIAVLFSASLTGLARYLVRVRGD
jgi:hypothetical protein